MGDSGEAWEEEMGAQRGKGRGGGFPLWQTWMGGRSGGSSDMHFPPTVNHPKPRWRSWEDAECRDATPSRQSVDMDGRTALSECDSGEAGCEEEERDPCSTERPPGSGREACRDTCKSPKTWRAWASVH